MNPDILKSEVQCFIATHLQDDVTKIALSKSPFGSITSAELAEQIDSKKRSEKKLPLWFNTADIYFPPKLSIEQSSSELTAEYKSRLLKGKSLIDLTGGFGVDTLYFSKVAKEVIHCEQNENLSLIAKHNAEKLGRKNIKFISTNSIQYLLENDKTYDTIYLDPSRRIQSRKVFLLADTEPNVVTNLGLLLSRSTRVIVKTSPLFDITSGLKELINVSEIHVISIKNDCKELLWVIDKDYQGDTKIVCVAIGNETQSEIRFSPAHEKALEISTFSAPLQYLYEPDVALMKAGCFKSIAQTYGVIKLHVNSHLYTSDDLRAGFIGKKLKVIETMDYGDFKKVNRFKKANIISRNFPRTPEQLKTLHKLSDGGTDFLIFTKVHPNRLVVIHAVVI